MRLFDCSCSNHILLYNNFLMELYCLYYLNTCPSGLRMYNLSLQSTSSKPRPSRPTDIRAPMISSPGPSTYEKYSLSLSSEPRTGVGWEPYVKRSLYYMKHKFKNMKENSTSFGFIHFVKPWLSFKSCFMAF